MKKAAPKKIFVITGVSGAGKSQALKVFEDFGWFCVDNLPIALLDRQTHEGLGHEVDRAVPSARGEVESPRSGRYLSQPGAQGRHLGGAIREQHDARAFAGRGRRQVAGRGAAVALEFNCL